MDWVFEQVADAEGWQAAQEIRERVFVEEQSCPPEEEFDEFDACSRHLLLRVGGEPAATARWRTVEKLGREWAKLERFAVLPEYRGAGIGRALVEFAMSEARQARYYRFLIHAQAHLKDFYASFGFEAIGQPFEEAGITHLLMIADEAA